MIDELAKPHLDVGLYTNDLEPMLAFWRDEVGLVYEELLKAGGGVHQHRFGMNGSVLKLNHAREPLPEAPPSGYRELRIARHDVESPRAIEDPDGNRVLLVPKGHQGVVGIGVHLAVRDADAFHRFYREGLGLAACGESAYRFGTSVLSFEEDPAAKAEHTMFARGFRYLTVQVYRVDREHEALVARGVREARPPFTLGSTARISFVRDPDGDWIEISQRASLTGSVEVQPG